MKEQVYHHEQAQREGEVLATYAALFFSLFTLYYFFEQSLRWLTSIFIPLQYWRLQVNGKDRIFFGILMGGLTVSSVNSQIV